MLSKLPKWFYSSFRDHINTTVGATYQLYFSGDESEPDAKIDVVIIGPTIEPIAKDQYQIEMLTNFTIKVPVEEDKEYLVHTMGGVCLAAISGIISIYKYGDGAEKLGCMNVPNNSRRRIRYVHHGIVEPNTELVQATVNARHELTLNLGD